MNKLQQFISSFFILIALNGCAMFTPPSGLDLSMTRPSVQGIYTVSMHPLVDAVEINQMHSWEISIATSKGIPVTGAQINFDGGMPQHLHGFPTHPRVTKELGGGRYRLDGVKFSMTGWWEMKVKIQSEQGNDAVTFNTVISSPTSFHGAVSAK
ncbi:Auxin-binding protein [Undibacterium parvum]|uniref:Auxin-binding protein n=3 Tax=Undibacterium TaxID=401469 RepID=A0A6M4AB39_9BURK|nr:Auxin-binding protein [Undibacterium parvum]QJQ07617.1 Auxin-binding protein [Undibacterium piscinae]